jgi:hypothetical protein
LRRIITIGAALTVLVSAAVAVAAAGNFNSYTATESFSPAKAGTPAKPSAFTVAEHWTASGNNGHQTAPLTRIVAKIYGERTNGKDFPTCTAAKINGAGNAHGWNKACPGGETGPALIGQGPVKALFVAGSQPTEKNPPQCNPYLYIYNGGQGTQVFFFTEYPYAPGTQYTCLNGAVKTGAAGAYNGYVTQPSKSNGNMWQINIPLPANVSTSAGGIPNNYASLVKLDVTYAKKTIKKNGKTIAYGASIGCKSGKRPYSFTFYAQNYQGQSPHTQTTTVSHTAGC